MGKLEMRERYGTDKLYECSLDGVNMFICQKHFHDNIEVLEEDLSKYQYEYDMMLAIGYPKSGNFIEDESLQTDENGLTFDQRYREHKKAQKKKNKKALKRTALKFIYNTQAGKWPTDVVDPTLAKSHEEILTIMTHILSYSSNINVTALEIGINFGEVWMDGYYFDKWNDGKIIPIAIQSVFVKSRRKLTMCSFKLFKKYFTFEEGISKMEYEKERFAELRRLHEGSKNTMNGQGIATEMKDENANAEVVEPTNVNQMEEKME
jgi:hypothetical protein